MKIQNERLSQEALNTVIVDINKAILTVKKSQGTVFTLLKNAASTLAFADYEKVKDGIDLHISSINKMEQIFKNEIVMGSLEKLPISWGTLYELALMSGEMLLANIESGNINSKTTKDEASKIRKVVEASATAESEDKVEASATAESEDKVEASATAFTFTLKETAKTHKNDIKELITLMEEYFEIPSNLELFFNEVEA